MKPSRKRTVTSDPVAHPERPCSQAVLNLAGRIAGKLEFLREALLRIQADSGCEEVEFREQRAGALGRFRAISGKGFSSTIEPVPVESAKKVVGKFPQPHDGSEPASQAQAYQTGRKQSGVAPHQSPSVDDRFGRLFDSIVRTRGGAGTSLQPSLGSLCLKKGVAGGKTIPFASELDSYSSLLILPVMDGFERMGILLFKSSRKDGFTRKQTFFLENLVESFGIAISIHRTQWALRERIKELTCLYAISRISEKNGTTLDGILREIVEVIPPAWQYPEQAGARIILDARMFISQGKAVGGVSQVAEIVVGGEKRGVVEVWYSGAIPSQESNPFLPEEEELLKTIAREVSGLVERRQAGEEKVRLQDQLRHADRLATIGQLAAGVAHELNEPLAMILGFSQLIKGTPKIPQQVEMDAEKIIKGTLHAREVIKKLLFFSRQMPTKKVAVDINKVVEEGLYFLESRCLKEGIEIERHLSPNLTPVTVDLSQINQVLVNLVVNALQAMPHGGKLALHTGEREGRVFLAIVDTGTGMDQSILKKLFTPFFTTKEVGQGTGLGLAVAHGIISSHGGTIRVESQVGKGSRFEISLPCEASEQGIPGGGTE